MTESNLRGKDNLLNLLESCLAGAPGDQVELVLEAEKVAVTRYANNTIHQNVWQDDTRVAVRVLASGAVATLICNSLDPAKIKETIAEAAVIARRQPSTRHGGFPAHSNLSGDNQAPGTEGIEYKTFFTPTPAAPFFESTASQTPLDRAKAVGQVIELIKSNGYEGYGTYKTIISELAVVNSKGLRAYAPATSGYLKVLVENGTGNAGYADQFDRDVHALDPLKTAEFAIKKCKLNFNQIDLPPGKYAAVLEPNAVADMVRFMVIHGCGAQLLQDGRSFMTDKFGEVVTGTNINIWEDPNHLKAMPFQLDYEGLTKRAVPLVIGGKATGVVYDTTTARKAPGHVSTGHAPSPISLMEPSPLPEHVVMEGGTSTLDELIGGLKRGLVITRFHYTHCPDPKRVIATGTTRDGTFLVENGEIVAAVKNLRYAQSVLELLSGVEDSGAAKTCQDWWAANGMGTTNYYLPAIRVSNCNFTGVTTY
jgi:PmbA protein